MSVHAYAYVGYASALGSSRSISRHTGERASGWLLNTANQCLAFICQPMCVRTSNVNKHRLSLYSQTDFNRVPTAMPQWNSMTFPWLFHDFSMTLYAFFHDYFTRLKCQIYEKCCNNHHTRPGHTFAIVTISKYVLDLQRVLSVSFIVKTFVNNVVRSVFHKKDLCYL